ncbi:MAG: redoxin domain-containing protein [candidate division Zixibacteria bacterium]|nr:redoxin domain-containing protein [candidate division Zixibacteria bacterium]
MKKIITASKYLLVFAVAAAVAYFSALKVGAYINNKRLEQKKQAVEQNRKDFTKTILDKMQTLSIGDTLPDHRFEDLYRRPVYLSELLKGQTILIFFDPYCENCNEEMNAVNQAVTELREYEYFIFISGENPRLIEEIPELSELKSPVLYDHHREYIDRFKIFTFPFNIVIDKDRVVREIYGQALTPEEITRVIEHNR